MPNLNLNASSRERAYRVKMLELGLEPTFVETNDNYGSWNFEEFGFRVMDEHFNKQRHIHDALICANDRIAIGAIRAANRHGLFATSDGKTSKFRIAGHDDHPLSAYVYPALTTVAQDIDGIAAGAVKRTPTTHIWRSYRRKSRSIFRGVTKNKRKLLVYIFTCVK